ncbi:GNAT family N-acetyltransferase [Nitratireductor kimnyeongensis]|uniref:GNAT family N-acetyltransferase n=1 Tax=Nitratireductor kimnyeongensis TaxID=430679 RepID=A0ABW0T807_9HYPH|nr:N-acetyltransferase [Nitratireductor kimnyeongensis]QZZ36258.1 N-acetyltransferase [Nitratireductor kimnyeongensis]
MKQAVLGSAFAPAYSILCENDRDAAERETLLDRVMGPRRKSKSSEKLRRGRLPADGLAFIAREPEGRMIGTVRLWNVSLGNTDVNALLLGPLAVVEECAGQGVGAALMLHAIAEARRLEHLAILLVGDAGYYGRFGFSADLTAALSMPGPYETNRFLALELVPGALSHASGVLYPSGRKAVVRSRVA